MTPRRYLFFPLFLVAYELVLYLANDAYLPAMVEISDYFAITSTQATMTLTAFFVGNSCFQLLLGPLSDNFGRRRILFIGGLGFCLGSLVCAFSGSFSVVLIGRFFQGLAVSSMSVAGYGTIHRLFDEKRAIQTLAWMGAVTVLAPAFGPFLGALFLQVGNWQQLFIALLTLGVVALFGLNWVMPETASACDKASVRETFSHYRRLLANRTFVSTLLSLGAIFAANIAWITAGALITMQGFHLSMIQYGLYQAGIFSCFLLGSRVVNRQIKKHSSSVIKNWILMLCLVVITLAIISLKVTLYQLQWLMVTLMSLSFTSGIAFPIYNRQAIDSSKEPMGIRMAVFAFAVGLSATVGSLMVSAFYQGHLNHFLWIVIACCSLPLFLQRAHLRQIFKARYT